MKSFGSVPAAGRRAALALGLAACAVLCAASGLTATSSQQTPPPAQTPAPAAQAPDQMKFSTDATLILMQVAVDNAADFELVMNRLKEALAKSDKPERKAQAAHWQVFKADTPPNNGLALYVMVLNPVTKDMTYDPMKILQESGVQGDELQGLYTKLSGALKGMNLVGLNKAVDMGSGMSGGQ